MIVSSQVNHLKKHYINDLSTYLNSLSPSITKSKEWAQLVNDLNIIFDYKLRKLKRKKVSLDITYINILIKKIKKSLHNDNSSFWIKSLESAKTSLSDLGLKTDFRDQQMADNLIWIQEQSPNKKIIWWGATSHFLYNSKSIEMKSLTVLLLGGNCYKNHLIMADHLKTKYGTRPFTIGFTAFQGKYGFISIKKKMDIPKHNTLEFLLSKAKYENLIFLLSNLSFENYPSRPLGNYYMKNDISKVMDAIIFNRNMKRPRLDNNLFLKVYPENKNIKPETES